MILLIIILIFILAGGGFITLFFLSANPPVETIDRYSQVLSKARQAEAGEYACRRSITVKDSMHHDLAVILTEVENKLKHYADRYGLLPLNQKSRQDYRTSEKLFLEAKAAYERRNYNRVVPKLEKSRKLIGESIRKSQEMLSLTRWERWFM
ncbi:MAG: hypothetical protein ISS17_06310 [Bacteroidales bacterium]|nr:hypothetical protein [Bacteroidales bacterium]